MHFLPYHHFLLYLTLTSPSTAYSLGGAGWKEAPYQVSQALPVLRELDLPSQC